MSIFGTYPCCDGDLHLAMPKKSPAYFPEDCPHCGARVWHRLSRVESVSWTETDFLAEYDVDEETKSVTAKPGTEAEAFRKMQTDPALLAEMDKLLARMGVGK